MWKWIWGELELSKTEDLKDSDSRTGDEDHIPPLDPVIVTTDNRVIVILSDSSP